MATYAEIEAKLKALSDAEFAQFQKDTGDHFDLETLLYMFVHNPDQIEPDVWCHYLGLKTEKEKVDSATIDAAKATVDAAQAARDSAFWAKVAGVLSLLALIVSIVGLYVSLQTR